jgi:alpha-N-acetylglucosamine transferase
MKVFLLFCMVLFCSVANAQKTIEFGVDAIIKERLYNENKTKVVNFSMKEFDKLFFEFFDMKSKVDQVLTKEQFYTYTMKIAAFSDRLAVLYPKEKEVAAASKKKWFTESYEDYLLSKESQKK